MKARFAIAAASVMLLAACGTDAPPPPAPDAAKPAPLPASNVYSSDVKALQKAKDVQNIVNEQKRQQDKAIEDSGG